MMLTSEDGNITLLSAEDFMRSYTPPKFIVSGIIQSGFVTTITAQVGHGKTALLTYLAFCIASGMAFGGHDTKIGNVIYIAGENDQDVIQRLAAQAQVFGISAIPDNIKVMTIKNSHEFLKSLDQMDTSSLSMKVDLVIVDTAAAIFNGNDENDNVQMKEFATRIRALVKKFPGYPAIVMACHPSKNSQDTRPRGGSALYAEIDCAIVVKRDRGIITISPDEKFRGKRFDATSFQLVDIDCDRILDSDGSPIHSVAISPTVIPAHEKRATKKGRTSRPLKFESEILEFLGRKNNVKLSEIINFVKGEAKMDSFASEDYILKEVQKTIKHLRSRSFLKLDGKTYQLASQ